MLLFGGVLKNGGIPERGVEGGRGDVAVGDRGRSCGNVKGTSVGSYSRVRNGLPSTEGQV